ncbi:Uncharacterised protein [uncultured archaeon]|nr:Uncharacterised protein [uncultured archaeon]
MDFQELVDTVRSVEKSAGEKKPYAGAVELPKTVDFSPEEFVDNTYQDLLNEYGRMQKVAKASGIMFKEFAARVETQQTAAQKGAAPGLKVLQPAAKAPPAPAKAVQPQQPAKPAPVSIPAPEKKPVVLPAAQPASKEAKKAPVVLAPLKPPVLAPPPVPPAPPEKEEPGKAGKEKEFEFDFMDKEEKPAEAAPKEERKAELSARISELMSQRPAEKKQPAAQPEPPNEGEKPAAAKPHPHGFEFEKEEMKPARSEEEETPAAEEAEKPAFDFEAEDEHKLEPRKEVEISQAAKEAMGEASEIPYLENHERVSLVVPPLLSIAPEQAAESKYAEVESKVPTVLESTNEADTKKRMIELTKQLFKEKSIDQRQKIKEEIAGLREMLSRKAELPKRAVSYATSFYNTMEVAEKMEIVEAK